MDRYELRRLDYSLTEDHKDLAAAYRQLLESHCPIEVVWAAQESGFDKSLWERLCATGASSMALGEDVGGDGATLVDLALVAEELGRVLAPVPWIDHVCAARLAERLGAVEADVVEGSRILGLDVAPNESRELLPRPRPEKIDPTVAGDGLQPCLETRRPASELCQPAPGAKERLLLDVLRVLEVFGHAQRDPPDGAVVRPHQGAERVMVPGARVPQQFRFVHSHCGPSGPAQSTSGRLKITH